MLVAYVRPDSTVSFRESKVKSRTRTEVLKYKLYDTVGPELRLYRVQLYGYVAHGFSYYSYSCI